jgi:hypothetical protein
MQPVLEPVKENRVARGEMMRIFLSVALTSILISSLARADCSCGPLYCLGDPDFAAELQAKQGRLAAQGVPQRLIDLLARDGKSRGCLEQAPDSFHILNVRPDGGSYTTEWDEDNERISHGMVDRGELSEYYIYAARKVCACCDEAPAEQRQDYDSQHELNTSIAIRCSGGPATSSYP